MVTPHSHPMAGWLWKIFQSFVPRQESKASCVTVTCTLRMITCSAPGHTGQSISASDLWPRPEAQERGLHSRGHERAGGRGRGSCVTLGQTKQARAMSTASLLLTRGRSPVTRHAFLSCWAITHHNSTTRVGPSSGKFSYPERESKVKHEVGVPSATPWKAVPGGLFLSAPVSPGGWEMPAGLGPAANSCVIML